MAKRTLDAAIRRKAMYFSAVYAGFYLAVNLRVGTCSYGILRTDWMTSLGMPGEAVNLTLVEQRSREPLQLTPLALRRLFEPF
jgi:hypothetical protein